MAHEREGVALSPKELSGSKTQITEIMMNVLSFERLTVKTATLN